MIKKQLTIMSVFLLALLLLGGCSDEQKQKPQGEDNFDGQKEILEVHFIDVDQGDATLITYGDYHILIDAGHNNQGERVVNYLKSVGVTELTYIIATHPDADHVGGLDTVLDAFDVDYIMDSGYAHTTNTYQDFLEAIGRELTDGETIFYEDDSDLVIDIDDGVYLELFDTGDEFTDLNDYSIIGLLVYHDVSFFLSADMEREAELAFIERVKQENIDIAADVLKAGHHGSRTSSSNELLTFIKPDYVLISAGIDNSYGHPHSEALDRFKNHTENIYVTYESCPLLNDLCSIVVTTDGTIIKVEAEPLELIDLSVSETMSFVEFVEDFSNAEITFTVLGEPNTNYDIELILPSGTTSSAASLGQKVSDNTGIVSWTYTFSSRTIRGTGTVKVINSETNETIVNYYNYLENE